jgi:hypothetical protein
LGGQKGGRWGKIQAEKISSIWRNFVYYFKQIRFCQATIYNQTIPGKLGMSAFQGFQGIVDSSKIERVFEIIHNLDYFQDF